MKKLNIKLLTKDFLIQEYINNKKSSIKIAKEVNCSPTTVNVYLKRNNIKIRSFAEHSLDCGCASCKSKRGEYKGKNHPFFGVHRFGKDSPRYIDGRSLKKYYCSECEKKGIKTEINWQTFIEGNGLCAHCWAKLRFSIPENNTMYGKKQSNKCKDVNRIIHLGNKYALGSKRPSLVELNKSRRGIPLKDSTKLKISINSSNYWKSIEGLKQKLVISKINKQWAKAHPEEVLRRGKLGHKKCPRISSLEKKVFKILNSLSIKFVPQYEYKLGFADIFIEPNKIIFVNGDYWHNYPMGTKKDKKQIEYLKENNYKILVIWEHELSNLEKVKNRVIQFNNK
jgi:G:T-mismatch repair DNA endonuclease (very short patch repair protein)